MVLMIHICIQTYNKYRSERRTWPEVSKQLCVAHIKHSRLHSTGSLISVLHTRSCELGILMRSVFNVKGVDSPVQRAIAQHPLSSTDERPTKFCQQNNEQLQAAFLLHLLQQSKLKNLHHMSLISSSNGRRTLKLVTSVESNYDDGQTCHPICFLFFLFLLKPIMWTAIRSWPPKEKAPLCFMKLIFQRCQIAEFTWVSLSCVYTNKLGNKTIKTANSRNPSLMSLRTHRLMDF